tara:strand:- start:723 stop:1163 length:441 start_codon:yes stop_codon:yes gene_type:complete
MFKPDHIVIHHTATKDDESFNKDNVKDIHTAKRWRDIGYHFVVENVEGEFEVIVGRPLNIMGAHCKGFNQRSIGVAYVGNFEIAPPPPGMVRVGVDRIIVPLALALNIQHDRVVAHRNTGSTPTVCPGRYFPMDEITTAVKAAFIK